MADSADAEPGACSVRRRTESSRRFGHASRMSASIGIKAIRKKPVADERGEYLIDGFRVSFLHQAEWNCDCREFSAVGTCRHTREAVGMREAQASIRRRTRPRLARLNQRAR